MKEGTRYACPFSAGFTLSGAYAMPSSHQLSRLSGVSSNYPNLTLSAPAAERQAAILGHARDEYAPIYHERVGDDRLQAVVDHVHK